jgi:adenylate cyclase
VTREASFNELSAALGGWLVESGLAGTAPEALLAELCRRLRAGGIPVDRGGCAILTLHPQIVSREISWRADDDHSTTVLMTPEMMQDPDNLRGPYFQLAFANITRKRFPLTDGEPAPAGSLLARLRAEGYTEYFGFLHPTGGVASISAFARRMGLGPSVVGSFATRRPGGFDAAEIGCFEALSQRLALAVRAWANYDMAARLLDLYVGRSCGSQVLDGRIARGDTDRIACGIWFCDLRRSSRLVSDLPLEAYIALLNRYFDATAGAVMAEGGEVLKFIGDAVLGIFPSDAPARDVPMRERALAAAHAALRDTRGLTALGQPLAVGIALHVGEVMYGNVGSDARLDFTVIGRAVNEAARLQGLAKQQDEPILASSAFVAPIAERFEALGAHRVAGFDDALAIYRPRT